MRRRELLTAAPATLLAGSAGCTIGGRPPEPDDLTLSSSAIDGEIPVRFTCDGAGESPPLTVRGVPDGTESLAVVGEWLRGYDPGTIWLLWDLPPEDPLEVPGDRPAVERLEDPAGAAQGRNDEGELGYRSPCHRTEGDDEYRFSVFALETELDIDPGAGRDAFDDAIESLVLSSTSFTATYDRL